MKRMLIFLIYLNLAFLARTEESTMPSIPKLPLSLYAIARVESNNGTNTSHTTVKTGIHANDRAIGLFGLMPKTVRHTITTDKSLSDYLYLTKLSSSKIEKLMKKNPEIGHRVALSLWNKLLRRFNGDRVKMYHAWLNGAVGTQKAIERGEDLSNHWYVIRVMKARKRLKNHNL